MKKLLIAMLLIPSIASAEYFSGNTLHQRLQSTDVIDRMMAMGYILGVSDAFEGTAHCSGQSVTSGQTRDVVKLYLEQNPSVRDLTANIIVMVSLSNAFPCPKTKQKSNGKT